MTAASSSTSSSSTTTRTAMRDHYRGAIALNNMGVSHLERGDYRHAMETFRDAIDVVKVVVNYVENDEVDLPEDGGHDGIRSMLRRAAGDLTSPRPARRKTVKGPATTTGGARRRSNKSASDLNVVPYDDGDLVSIKPSLSNGPCLSLLCPVRIESAPVDLGKDEQIVDLSFESGIVLYNYGLSYMCMYLESVGNNNNERAAARHLDKALKIFHVNVTLLWEHCADCSDAYQQTRLLLLSALVQNGIVLASAERAERLCSGGGDDGEDGGGECDVNEATARMIELVDALDDIDSYSDVFGSAADQRRCAPAA